CLNLALLTLHALFAFLPSVYWVFALVFWEGLLGGLVYVSTFAEIADAIADEEEREWSLGATSVSDSGGVCVAGFIGMAMEVALCDWQVRHGRDWCRKL
ncbi:battenin CLN3 protein, partial [Elasticomyces elasticus]